MFCLFESGHFTQVLLCHCFERKRERETKVSVDVVLDQFYRINIDLIMGIVTFHNYLLNSSFFDIVTFNFRKLISAYKCILSITFF